MRALQALALAVALTATTAATTFAGDGGGYASPNLPTDDAINGDGGGYAAPSAPSDISYGEVWA